MSQNDMSSVPGLLVAWHRKNKRELPWRADRSAYHIWLSEIMLQQTRIEAVIPYYRRFLQELPTIEDLANVPEEKLLKLWEGLGYYSRARNLKKAAVMIMEKFGGQLPVTARELRSLPGIGDYTAGAIASMAFGQPEPAVDGNVLRVLARLTADASDVTKPAVKTEFTQKLRAIYPTGPSAGDFTEGLMELGETVCIPGGVPKCEACPVAGLCEARRRDLQTQLPVRSEKKPRTLQQKTVFILQCGRQFALHRRPEEGLLSGMWEWPNVEGHLRKAEILQLAAKWGCDPVSVEKLPAMKHVFTHIEWNMWGYVVNCRQISDSFVWVTKEQITGDYALPVAFGKFLPYIEK